MSLTWQELELIQLALKVARPESVVERGIIKFSSDAIERELAEFGKQQAQCPEPTAQLAKKEGG